LFSYRFEDLGTIS
jgi:hypothetical protein